MNPSPSEKVYDLAVLGGGIMGLACAFEAVCQGQRVAVLDPNPLGRKASWAAAGILVGRAGVVGSSPFREFYLRSLAEYPDWLKKIENESGMKTAFERGGDYQVFPLDNPDSLRSLEARESQLSREKSVDFSVRDAWPDFLKPHARSGPVRVFHFPNEAYVNNRELLSTLETALRKRGVDLFPGRKPVHLSHAGGNQLEGDGWKLRTKNVLITAGAWSNDILKLLGWMAPIIPVKGQLASFPAFHAEKTMIHCQEKLYMIPRGKSIIAGSTTEPENWGENFDAFGDEKLRASLRDFFPNLKPEWSETWSGIRPRTRDRLPIMGWVDEKNGIAICAGHYKSGISLAPLAGKCMAELLSGKSPSLDLRPFHPLRKAGLKQIKLSPEI